MESAQLELRTQLGLTVRLRYLLSVLGDNRDSFLPGNSWICQELTNNLLKRGARGNGVGDDANRTPR